MHGPLNVKFRNSLHLLIFLNLFFFLVFLLSSAVYWCQYILVFLLSSAVYWCQYILLLRQYLNAMLLISYIFFILPSLLLSLTQVWGTHFIFYLAKVSSVLLYITVPPAATSGSAYNAVIFYYYLMHNTPKYYLSCSTCNST